MFMLTWVLIVVLPDFGSSQVVSIAYASIMQHINILSNQHKDNNIGLARSTITISTKEKRQRDVEQRSLEGN
ncbi:hypothetical protein CR513_54155, partial [Mucuna pruriens]